MAVSERCVPTSGSMTSSSVIPWAGGGRGCAAHLRSRPRARERDRLPGDPEPSRPGPGAWGRLPSLRSLRSGRGSSGRERSKACDRTATAASLCGRGRSSGRSSSEEPRCERGARRTGHRCAAGGTLPRSLQPGTRDLASPRAGHTCGPRTSADQSVTPALHWSRPLGRLPNPPSPLSSAQRRRPRPRGGLWRPAPDPIHPPMQSMRFAAAPRTTNGTARRSTASRARPARRPQRLQWLLLVGFSGDLFIRSCSIGCTDGSDGRVVTCAVVNVTENQEISILFSEPIDPTSVTPPSGHQHGERHG